MNHEPAAALQHARDLLQARQIQSARALLAQIVTRHPREPEAWWLLACALDDRDQQVYALQRALRLDPQHAQARARLAALLSAPQNPPAVAAGHRAPGAAPPAAPGVPAAAPRTPHSKTRPAPLRGIGVILAGVLAVAALGIAGVYAMSVYGSRSQAAPPPQATAGLPPSPLPTSTRVRRTATPTAPPTPTQRPAPSYAADFLPAACPFRKPEGATVECGFVVVPEDRAGDPHDTIRLAVAIYRATTYKRSPEAVVFLQGGPGGYALEYAAGLYADVIDPLLQDRDVVVFDQRGVGFSEPALDCPELLRAYAQDMHEHPAPAERATLYTDALVACRDRLTRNGANLAAYTTAAGAADVHDLITVLGYGQVDLYGISYGTRLAQAVLRDYPQSIRSAVLDSVVPMAGTLYGADLAPGSGTLDTLFADCAATPGCHAAFPDLPEVYASLVRQLDAAPISVTATVQGQSFTASVDGAALTNSLLWMLRSRALGAAVPRTIYLTRAGDYRNLSYAMALPAWTFTSTSLGVMLSTGCHEQIYATTPAELDAYLVTHPSGAAVDLPALFDSGAALFRVCELWRAAPLEAREQAPATSDIPTLLIAGAYDSSTPPEFARQIHGGLSRSYYFEFPGYGHAPTLDGEPGCPSAILAAFLDDPHTEPGRACLAGLEPVRFEVPYTGTQPLPLEAFTNSQIGFDGLRPAGWKPAQYGYYNRSSSYLDRAQYAVQGVRGVTPDEWLVFLMREYNDRRGFDALPVATGTRAANGLTWQLYAAGSSGQSVAFALAQSGSRALLVLLACDPDEYDALVAALFLPGVDSVRLAP